MTIDYKLIENSKEKKYSVDIYFISPRMAQGHIERIKWRKYVKENILEEKSWFIF